MIARMGCLLAAKTLVDQSEASMSTPSMTRLPDDEPPTGMEALNHVP